MSFCSAKISPFAVNILCSQISLICSCLTHEANVLQENIEQSDSRASCSAKPHSMRQA